MIGDNAKIVYKNFNQTLQICNSKSLSPVKKVEGKYGVELWYDIEDTPALIVIPEPHILFGIEEEFFKDF